MNDSAGGGRLKRYVPAPVWNYARLPVIYARRMRIWTAVMTELEGASPADQAILRRSFRLGFVSALRRPNQWQDPQLVANASIRVRGIGRFNCRASTDDLYHLLPSREPAVVAAIRQRLAKRGTFVDAGANIGFFSVLAGQTVGPDGRVFAIEMIKETASRLRLNIRENELTNIEVLEHALSDVNGKRISATMPQEKYGRASIVFPVDGEEHRSVSVRTRTIDDLFADVRGGIDLVKMDLEGAEAQVLRGAGQTLQRTKGVIFEQLPGETEAGRLLEQLGFRLSMLDARNVLAERE